MIVLEFFVPGIASPGGSKKAFRHRHTGKVIVQDMGGERTKAWREVVAGTAFAAVRQAGHGLFTGPLAVEVVFTVPRPRSHYTRGKGVLAKGAPPYPTTRPDATKLWRSTEDAMTGIVWSDDAQIVRQTVVKVYGETPGARISVKQV